MINGINHITIAVTDIERSFNFYKQVLGFKPLCKWKNGAYFLAGNIWFCLNYDAHTMLGHDYTHIAFNVLAEDFIIIKNKIVASGATIFKDNLSEGNSLYFLDPDKHKLEIHVGDWLSRIESKKRNAGGWQDAEFFV